MHQCRKVGKLRVVKMKTETLTDCEHCLHEFVHPSAQSGSSGPRAGPQGDTAVHML